MSLAKTSRLLSTHGVRHVVVSGFDPDELEVPKLVFPPLRDWQHMGGSAAVCMDYILRGVACPSGPGKGSQATFSIGYASGDADNGTGTILYNLRASDLFRWFPSDKRYDTNYYLYFDGTDFVQDRNLRGAMYTAKQAYIELCKWYKRKFGTWPGVRKSLNAAPEFLKSVYEQAEQQNKPFRDVLKNVADAFRSAKSAPLEIAGPSVPLLDDKTEQRYQRALVYLQTLPADVPMNWTRVIQALFRVNRDKGENIRQREETNMLEVAQFIKWMADHVTFNVK